VQAVGADAPLKDIIGQADSYAALMWGSLLGVLVAAALSMGQGILSLEQTVEAWYEGLKSMLFAMVILVLAWALSNITEVLHTADYLVSVLGETLPPAVVPAIIFVLAAATAFATGSSWGTMGILMPLVVPLVWAILDQNRMADPAHYHIFYSAVSCVLAGSVWGDHCSPISDTTILSSMASGCDHIEHVRTQLPYALSVGTVAILFGTLPAGFGMPFWVGLLVGAGLLYGLLRIVGTPVPTYTPEREVAGEAA
jgi:Na+/H+ antiporter NhaC